MADHPVPFRRPSSTSAGAGISGDGVDGGSDFAGLVERIARVQEAISGLRHSQNLGTAAIGIAVAALSAIMIYVATDISGQVQNLNGRLDRFLEFQATRAQTVDSRLDRLLETLAAEARRSPPVVVTVPAPAPTPP